GRDSNPRPSGYEPDELPDCSTPRRRTTNLAGANGSSTGLGSRHRLVLGEERAHAIDLAVADPGDVEDRHVADVQLALGALRVGGHADHQLCPHALDPLDVDAVERDHLGDLLGQEARGGVAAVEDLLS